MALFASAQPTSAPQPYAEQTLQNVLVYNRMAEVKRWVTLTPEQEQTYRNCCVDYYKAMYQAIYVEKRDTTSSKMMYNAEKIIADTLMRLLSREQRLAYLSKSYAEEIHYRTQERVKTLEESGEYSAAELKQAYVQIYSYLMREKIAMMMHRYDIRAQREISEQLDAAEPAYLKDAKARRKLKAYGRGHLKGYK